MKPQLIPTLSLAALVAGALAACAQTDSGVPVRTNSSTTSAEGGHYRSGPGGIATTHGPTKGVGGGGPAGAASGGSGAGGAGR